jgi:predicted dehydrogenase
VIGRHHIRAASESPLVRVVAMADRIEERVHEVGDQYGIAKRYGEGSDLLDDPEVEAAILALPACGRFVLAIKALNKGIHLIIEKPVGMDAGQVEQMIAARGDLVAVCGQSRPRFAEMARQISAFIATGALGKLRVLNCRAIVAPGGPPTRPPPTWRLIRAENGGGILMNWGCYDLDYLLGLTGWALKPELVLGKTWTVPPTYASYIAPGSDAETHVTAMIVCDGGTVIHYERAEYAAARAESMWQITGSRASLHLHLTDTKNFVVTVDRATPDRGTVSETLFSPVQDQESGMRQQLDNFARAIREGRRPQTGLEEALLVQRISDAIYASSASGQAVMM